MPARSFLLLALLTSSLTACQQPLVQAQGHVDVNSAIPINGDVRMAGTVPIDGQVNITQPVPVQGVIGLTQPIQINVQGPSISYEGTYITDDLMKLITINQTSSEWVMAVLGEPNFRTTLSDGSEIWRWTYRPVRVQGSYVSFLNLGDKDPRPEYLTSFVRIRNGVVVEKWRG